MLHRFKTLVLFILGFALPWHGAITVFGPDLARFWKEALLGVLLITTILSLCYDIKTLSAAKLRERFLNRPVLLWGILFLSWGLVLVLLNQDLHTALVAYRYLGLGVFALLLGLLMWKTTFQSVKNGHHFGLDFFHKFCTGLTFGVFTGTIFGLWAKFAGGHAVLAQWYSNTISSWVPGQTIPLYHQVGDFIRVQGASSGPVEYSHLAVLGLWYVLFFKSVSGLQRTEIRAFIGLFLITGIWQSGSRAALLGAFILLVAKLYFVTKPKWPSFNFKWTVDKAAAALLVVIVLTGMAKFTLSKAVLGDIELLNKNVVRISDIDHLTRPIEAFKVALENPVTGVLGAFGPAARAKNLKENNIDYAPIAESVPFDIAAQMGFVGLLLWLGFIGFVFLQSATWLRVLIVCFTPLMLLATIFDMTPVSISFYLILGLGLGLPRVQEATLKDHPSVFNLKRLAFKRYTQQVWPWVEADQKNYVAQELAGGGIYLVQLEGAVVATFCLVPKADYTMVYSFYVHPEKQSLGLGAYLLNEVITGAALHLQVLKVNSGAKAFYLSHGFKTTGEDKNHWYLQRLTSE